MLPFFGGLGKCDSLPGLSNNRGEKRDSTWIFLIILLRQHHSKEYDEKYSKSDDQDHNQSLLEGCVTLFGFVVQPVWEESRFSGGALG